MLLILFSFLQENRRHARIVKKAGKLAVSELLEIVAMKGIKNVMTPKEEETEAPPGEPQIAAKGPPTSSSSSSGPARPAQGNVTVRAEKPRTEGVDVAEPRGEDGDQLPDGDF